MTRLIALGFFTLNLTAVLAQTDLLVTGGYNVSDPSELLLPVGGELTMFVIIENTTSVETTGGFSLELDGNGDYYIKSTTVTQGGSGSFGLKDADASWPTLAGNQTAEFVFKIEASGTTSGDITAILVYPNDTNPENNTVEFLITIENPLGSISGVVWNDEDRDGIVGDEELVLQDWLVYLDLNLNGEADDEEPVSFTNLTGQYAFNDLETGTYRVAVGIKPNWTPSLPNPPHIDVTLDPGENVVDQDFGVYPDFRIEVRTFADRNENGIRDEGEAYEGLSDMDEELSSILLNGEVAGNRPRTPVELKMLSEGEYSVDLWGGPKAVITTTVQTVTLNEEDPVKTVEFGFVRLYRLVVIVADPVNTNKKNFLKQLINRGASLSREQLAITTEIKNAPMVVRDSTGEVVAESVQGETFSPNLREGVYSVELTTVPDGFRLYWSLGDGFIPGLLESVQVGPESSNSVIFFLESLPPEIEIEEDGNITITIADGFQGQGSQDGIVWELIESGKVPSGSGAAFFRQVQK